MKDYDELAREGVRALARTYRNFLAETSRKDLTEEYLDEREEGFTKAVEAIIEQEKMKRLAEKSPRHQVGGDHYLKMNPQPIELLRSWLTPAEYAGFLRELQRTRLAATVQKMNEEIYRMVDLKCRYTVWEIAHHITNSDKIRYSDDSKLKTFLRAFNSPPPNEGVFDELRHGLRTDDSPDLSKLAYWFCCLSDNRLPENKRSAAAELFMSKQAVYIQCQKIRYALVDYNERLAEKWCNMVRFAAKIKKGEWYFYATLDEGNQPGMAIWKESKEDKHRFERGLCFLTDLDAKRWSEGML